MQAKHPFKLTTFQINAISLMVVGFTMTILLIVGIGYRDTTMGQLMVGAMAGVGLGIAIFAQPQLGVYVLVVSIFTNMSSILIELGFPGINKPLIALVFLSIAANRLLLYQGPSPLVKFKRSEWFLLAYGGAMLASSMVAQEQGDAIDMVVDFGKDFVILLCIVYALETRPGSWKRTVWLIILTAAVLAGLGTYQVLSGNIDQTFLGFSKFMKAQIIGNVDDTRLIGPIDDPNFYGQALVSILPLALYRLLDERKFWPRLAAGLATILLVVAVSYTYSRGAFLALVLVLLLTALERRVKPSLIILVVLAAMVVMPFLPARFTERMETLTIFTNDNATVYADLSFRGRTSEMLAGIYMFTDHPLLGVGIGNYEPNYQAYASRIGLEFRSEDRQAHSLYLETLAETGILGSITFGGLFVSLLLGLQQARRKLDRLTTDQTHWGSWIASLQIGLVAYLTTSIFLHGDYIRYLWLLVALGLAIPHIADYLERQAQAELPPTGTSA